MKFFTQYKDGSQGFGKIHLGLCDKPEWVTFCGHKNFWEQQTPTELGVVARGIWEIERDLPSRIAVNTLLTKGGGRFVIDHYTRDDFCQKCFKAAAKFQPDILIDI